MSVVCPKCGRPNPDEAYICQFCDTPLVTYNPPQIPEEQPPVEDETSPEWLEQLRKKKETDARKLGEDYFNRFGPVETPEDKIESVQGEGLDAWLDKIRTNKEKDPEALSPLHGEIEPVSESQQGSDWLDTIRSKVQEEVSDEKQPSSTEDGDDWLSNLRKQTEELTPKEESSPSWMAETQAPSETSEKPPVSPFYADDIDDMFPPEPETESPPTTPAIPSPVEEQAGGSGYSFYSSPIPEETEHPIPEQLRNSIPQLDADALADNDMPSEEQLMEMQDEPRERISSRDIPTWLTSILGENEAEATPLTAVSSSQEETPENEELVEPGKIPGWVQAMRPVEQAAPKEEIVQEIDKRIEENGPLAGIRGILPGEGLSPSYDKPGGYQIGLVDRQKTTENVAFFKDILVAETEEIKVPGYKRTRAAGTVRWIMMALLFVIILFPIITGAKTSSLPSNIPKETVSLFKAISTLPADARILVAVDYEPAYAGELQSAAGPVLNHLMVKQANLYVISTSPTGPALGQQLINSLSAFPQSFQTDYVSGEKYHILGYIPGGQAGILALNQSVPGAIPITPDITSSQNVSGLNGPNPISSFSGLLIISDQSDTIRYWLEQIRQVDGKPSIWVVYSAQAAPMLRPYVRSGQVEGLTSGEYGGTLYERIFQQPGIAWRQWNAFHTGLLAAVVLILLGGILNYTGQVILRARRNKTA
jgi:hypothetical protein